jgi:SAM-dependent MidA family methyltransferase
MESKDLYHEILQEISAGGGVIPFRRFMEMALYHPDHGYYASGKARVGKGGDFFTSVCLGAIYGRILASICREVWERLGRPVEFTIVEQGANDGAMAADILRAICGAEDDLSRSLRFLIVEPFEVNRNRQQGKLEGFPNVIWVSSLEELPEFTGIHLSNELLDAFPVDSLRWNENDWEEECVECRNGLLAWTSRPIQDPELQAAAGYLPKGLSTGFRVEINRGIQPWLSTLQAKLNRGIVLTVDYGQSGDDRYAPHRADGTLLAFEKHQRFHDPLPEPGLRDITAQVDFTALARSAREMGFEILGYSDQHQFLVGAAEPWLLSLGDLTEKSDAARPDLRALQTLLNPSTMGRQFKAIALGKGFPNRHPLSCFKYQRPGIEAL